VEISSGKTSYRYIRKLLVVHHGKETPKIYKELTSKCLDANPDKRPTAKELYNIFEYWYDCITRSDVIEMKYGYNREELRNEFGVILGNILN